MDFIEKAVVMTGADMTRVLARIASQIVENNPDLSNVLLVGIRRRGVPLAEKIATKIKEMDGVDVATGALDITLYRDDLSTVGERPVVNKTELPADITGKTIILVDDVLYTGRTIRAAMDELIDFGRPRRVQLAVLIDRGWRELPIRRARSCSRVSWRTRTPTSVELRPRALDARVTSPRSKRS